MSNLTDKQKWAFEEYDKLALKLGKNGKSSYKQAAKLIGVSDSILSLVRKEEYKGNNEKYLDILVEYFENEEKNRKMAFKPEYAETFVSKSCYKVMESCQILGGCARITGDAGIGKTQSIRKFAADHPETCVFITANPVKSSMKAVFKELGNTLDIKCKETNDIYEGIIQKLHSGMIIIIDEAQFLNANVINALRCIPDYFESRGETLGLCLVGNHSLKTKLERGNNNEIYEQVSDRSIFKPEFCKRDVSKEDIAMIIPQIKGKDKELEFLHQLMSLKGSSLRNVINVYTMALNNENTTYEGLKAAAEGISRLNRSEL